MPSYFNKLNLEDDVDSIINMKFVSSTIQNSYETIILQGMTPGKLSFDDQLIVSVRENGNNLTAGYEPFYHSKQYINNRGQTITEPQSAENNVGHRVSKLNITDMRDINFTTYVKNSRVIYLVFRRNISENSSDQKSMKDTPCNGTIQATNLGVSTKITLGWKYRPLTKLTPTTTTK